MRATSLLTILAQVAVMAYALQAVCSRINDRRAASADAVGALRGAVLFACLVLIGAALADILEGPKRFTAVRELWEIGFIAAAFSTGLAVKILRGEKKPAKGDRNADT